METIKEFLSFLSEYLDEARAIFSSPLFNFGKGAISLGTILYFIFSFWFLFFISSRARRLLTTRVLANANFELGLRETIGSATRLVIIVIGSIVIIQSAGIDLSALSLLAGALGVGIGFGLQNITDNSISGLIILFEKPIKVGDRIEVGDVNGDVLSISVRATTILTNDNISIIVPNSEFISKQVINWSHNDRNIRFRIPVGVSYNEDPEKIKAILLSVANDEAHVLKKPEPQVIFDGFGDSSLDFMLAVWTNSYIARPRILKSNLYFEIFKRFKEAGVEIPFPQRDIHIRSTIEGQADEIR
jgi:small-conductance mechanosensitive channel